jgi:uncharacterized membrane protein YkvA (DUF1232 family)
VALDLKAIRERARRLRLDAMALALAARHPGTPWYAKLLVVGCVAYVVTPVDFVPDFVPVLGVIDDIVFIPVALALAARFVPDAVLDECRGRAAAIAARRTNPRQWFARLLAAWRR